MAKLTRKLTYRTTVNPVKANESYDSMRGPSKRVVYTPVMSNPGTVSLALVVICNEAFQVVALDNVVSLIVVEQLTGTNAREQQGTQDYEHFQGSHGVGYQSQFALAQDL